MLDCDGLQPADGAARLLYVSPNVFGMFLLLVLDTSENNRLWRIVVFILMRRFIKKMSIGKKSITRSCALGWNSNLQHSGYLYFL